MFPLTTSSKTLSPSGPDIAIPATLQSYAPRLKDAAERVAGSLVKSLQKLAVTAGAIDGAVREVAWRDVQDVAGTLPPSGVASVVTSPPIACTMLVTLDELLVYGLVDLLCGGNGSERPPAIPRDATPIDQQFAQIAFTFLASAIEAEWADVGFTSTVVGRAEAVGSDLFGAHTTEVGCVDLAIGIFGLSGTIRLVMPPDAVDHFVTDDGMDDLDLATDDDWSARLRQEISQTRVKLDAYLDGNQIDLATLAALRVGQVIPLPPEARARVSLVSQSQVLFRGEIGQADDRYSLRIEDLVLDSRMVAPIVPPFSRSQTPELLRA